MLDDQLPQYTPFIAREMSLVISNHSSSVKAGSEPILDLSNKCLDWVSRFYLNDYPFLAQSNF